MGGKAVCKLLGLLLCAALFTGCAAAATTANVAQEEEEAVAAASVHGENIPLAKAAAEEDTAETASPTVDAHVVEITLPPVTATPAFLLEASATAGQQQPDQTPEVTPASTPAPTATPKNTPAAYTVEELDEYVDGYVNAKTINLRAGPGTGYEVLGEYERYDTLLVTGTCEEWYRVKLDGLRGYMLKEYVTIGKVKEAEPTPAPTPTPEASIPVVETPTPSASISQADELYLVAQVVQKEGDMESYVAVANVIYNRLHSSSFPNTIQEVIYQKNQFSTSNLKTPSTAAMAAVQQIFVDGNLILPAEVMYFHAASRGTDRSGYTYYATYGGNVFFYR